mmetsp:Transcript_36741/g.113297  ORF Transcript_36741/g.113297 Transcript_36741/m.113297 type:complete len:246 (-) Transcript_36741:254-991(-)
MRQHIVSDRYPPAQYTTTLRGSGGSAVADTRSADCGLPCRCERLAAKLCIADRFSPTSLERCPPPVGVRKAACRVADRLAASASAMRGCQSEPSGTADAKSTTMGQCTAPRARPASHSSRDRTSNNKRLDVHDEPKRDCADDGADCGPLLWAASSARSSLSSSIRCASRDCLATSSAAVRLGSDAVSRPCRPHASKPPWSAATHPVKPRASSAAMASAVRASLPSPMTAKGRREWRITDPAQPSR